MLTADSVIVDLEARIGRYVADMAKAKKAHVDWKAEVTGSAGAVEAASRKEESSAERTAAATTKASRAVKAGAAERRTAAREQAAAADAAARAEEAAQARIALAVERGLARQAAAYRRGTGRFNTTGYSVQPGEISARPQSHNISGVVDDENRVNHLMRDRIDLQSRLSVATGRERVALQDQIAELRLIDQYKKAGLTETEAIARAELRINAIQAERLALQRRDQTATILRGVTGIAGALGRAAAFGSLFAGVGIAAGAQHAIEFAQALKTTSDQLGITTRDLQIYQAEAEHLGVSNDQLRSSFSQFANALGQAKEGSRSFQAIFRALGVDIRQFATAGDALPTVIDRISQIADPAQRAAVETTLFGEAGRRLDSMLGGGLARLNEFADGMDRTGQVLSAQDVAQLNALSIALGNIKRELEVNFAHVVAENANSILQLAQSFATLANSVISALGAIGRFRSQAVFRTSTGAEREQARGELMRSPEGRAYLMTDVMRRARETANLDPGNDPAAREAIRQRRQAIIAEGAGIITANRRPPEAATPFVAQPGTVNVRGLAGLRAPAGPRGPSAEQLERQAAQREQNYQRQMEQFENQRIAAVREQVVNDDQRAEIDRASIERELERTEADIALQVREHRIDAYRQEELVSAARRAAAARTESVSLEQREAARQQELQALQARAQIEVDLWHAGEEIADTMADRRTAGLALLELAERQERAELEAVIASEKASDAQKAIAQQRLGILADLYRYRREAVTRSTEGPLEAYRRTVNRTTAQINEDVQGVAVNGLTQLNDGLADAITGAKSLGEVFHDVAQQIIRDLLRIAIQQAIIKPLANALFSSTNGGSGGFLGTLASAFQTAGTFTGGKAIGGPVMAGDIFPVGERGPELFQAPSSGRIIPNNRLALGGGNQPARVTLLVQSSGEFEARVIDISSGVAVETVRAAAPAIVDAAKNLTLREATRPRLNGG